MRNTLLEASKYDEALLTIKSHLIKEQGLSLVEANYVTSFYSSVRNLNLFSSNYFKNFEYDGELFDLSNIQKFAKFPETFYDIVMLVMHNKVFLEKFQVDFDGVHVKLTKKQIGTSAKEEVKDSTPFDEYKIAEDENYYTFHLPTYQVAMKLRTFYSTMFPNDDDIKAYPSFFHSGWCIASAGAKGYFSQQRHKATDIWLVTFRKDNPAENLRKRFGVDSLKNAHGSVYEAFSNYQRNQLGEVYLMKSDGTRGGGRNYGYHNYINFPGYGQPYSEMELKPTYSYSSLDVSGSVVQGEPFFIQDSILIKCYVNSAVVRVPEGVTEIGAGAFDSLKQVEHVILPMSLITIKEKAFMNMDQLHTVQTKNSLEVIEPGAFVNMGSAYQLTFTPEARKNVASRDLLVGNLLFIIGVIERTTEELDATRTTTIYTVKKPSKLRYAPREIMKAFKHFQETFSPLEENKKSKRKLKKESFTVRRASYEITDIYSIIGKTLILDAEQEDADKVTALVIPEGIEKVQGSLTMFRNLKSISFPDSTKDIKGLAFSGSKIAHIDLSNTHVSDIMPKQFADMLYLETVKLPKHLLLLGFLAFENSTVESVDMPIGINLGDQLFKNCPFIETIYVDDSLSFAEQTPESFLQMLIKNKIKIKER